MAGAQTTYLSGMSYAAHGAPAGSTRLVTDANANGVTRHDFLPFGEELPPGYAGRNGQWAPGGDNVDQKFTGQMRDQETGLDYFNARYFDAALGRFTSPDPGNTGADPSNPQSWNAYAYALNNPLVTVDPSGADPFDDGGGDGGGDDPCFWNPFLCGFSPLPPPIFVGGGGGRNNGTTSGQTADKTPLVGIPVIGDSSAFTNVLNYTSLKLGLNARFQGTALRSITKAAFGSVRIATVVGRANVVIGGALLAYDAASIAICTSR